MHSHASLQNAFYALIFYLMRSRRHRLQGCEKPGNLTMEYSCEKFTQFTRVNKILALKSSDHLRMVFKYTDAGYILY
jgi:hypothetical protein